MTDNEIIKVLKNETECIKRQVGKICDNKRDCKTCDLVMDDDDVIFAYNKAISVLEKQIPKKPTFGDDEQDYICCPNCNYELAPMDAYGDYFGYFAYCPECGQALDWSDEE